MSNEQNNFEPQYGENALETQANKDLGRDHTSTLDPESRNLVAQSKADNADLESNVAEVVADGQELSPVAKPTNSNDARKAIFKKHGTVRQKQLEEDRQDPGINGLTNMYEGADQTVKQTVVEPEPVPIQKEPEKPAEPEQVTEEPDWVTITVSGQKVSVPREDIDQAGSVEALQRNMAADLKFRKAAEMERASAETMRRAEELQESLRNHGPVQAEPQQEETPAAASPTPLNRDADASNVDDALDAEADSVIDGIFSGDREKAKQAYIDARKAEPQPAPVVTPQPIAPVQPVTRVESQPVAPQGRSVATLLPTERQAINEVMTAEFGDVLNDSDANLIGQEHFNRLLSSPENEARSAEALARQAGRFARKQLLTSDPIAQRNARKRAAPKTNIVQDQRHVAPPPERPDSNSDYIKKMRAARGQT